MDLIVLAKEPVPGRVKTRLCPPCTPGEAAALAAAALEDTLAVATATSADRVVLALDGRPGPWCPPGVDVVGQGPGTMADRLEEAWARARGPAVLIGMDTPQAGVDLLEEAMDGVRAAPAHHAVLGPADDGGWWLIGSARPRAGTFSGIATSRPDTGAHQLARLQTLGHSVGLLPSLVDVDTVAAARAVARIAPSTRFAAQVRCVLDGG